MGHAPVFGIQAIYLSGLRFPIDRSCGRKCINIRLKPHTRDVFLAVSYQVISSESSGRPNLVMGSGTSSRPEPRQALCLVHYVDVTKMISRRLVFVKGSPETNPASRTLSRIGHGLLLHARLRILAYLFLPFSERLCPRRSRVFGIPPYVQFRHIECPLVGSGR